MHCLIHTDITQLVFCLGQNLLNNCHALDRVLKGQLSYCQCKITFFPNHVQLSVMHVHKFDNQLASTRNTLRISGTWN